MIQNADDAGATEVCFLFDERNFGEKSLVHPELARFQGPALYSHNNATFKEQDWEGIRNLMKSNKKEDPLKIGRFGIGFNSVYHITGILERLYAFLHKNPLDRIVNILTKNAVVRIGMFIIWTLPLVFYCLRGRLFSKTQSGGFYYTKVF